MIDTAPDPTPEPGTNAAARRAAEGGGHTATRTQAAPSAPRPGFSEPIVGGGDTASPVAARAVPPSAPPPPAPAPSFHDDDDFFDSTPSQFDRAAPFRPRRNPLKIWTAAGAIFALLALGGVFAASYYGLPDWVPVSRPTFAVAQPDLLLDFPADQQDRRTLPDGSEFFSASGTITNTGRETRSVPSILIVMRNEREVPVYSWVLAPPKDSLAPGETVSINEIATDVPKNAEYAEIGWNPT